MNATSSVTAKIEPLLYYLLCFFRYAGSQDTFPIFTHTKSMSISSFSSSPSSALHLGPLHFELSASGDGTYSQTKPYSVEVLLQGQGYVSWIRGNPYLVLLQQYLTEVFPSSLPQPTSLGLPPIQTSVTDVDHELMDLWTSCSEKETVTSHRPSALSRLADLFLRLALEHWADSALVVKQGHDKVTGQRQASAEVAPINKVFMSSGMQSS